MSCGLPPHMPTPNMLVLCRGALLLCAEGKIAPDAESDGSASEGPGDGAELWSDDDDNQYYRDEVGEDVPDGACVFGTNQSHPRLSGWCLGIVFLELLLSSSSPHPPFFLSLVAAVVVAVLQG